MALRQEQKYHNRFINTLDLWFCPILCLIVILFLEHENIFLNLWKLLTSEALLITDYISVYGVSTALLNVGLVSVVNILLLICFNTSYNGLLLGTFYTVLGFSFIGINLLNILPIYLGGYLYAKFTKMHYKSILVICMLGGTLGPISSHIMFGYGPPTLFSVVIGLLVGIFFGFIIVPFGAHCLRYHDGFNLYNVGFSAGMLAIIYYAISKGLGYETIQTPYTPTPTSPVIMFILTATFLYLLCLGIFHERGKPTNLRAIFLSSGRAITDFTKIAGIKATYLNMAWMGGLILVISQILGSTIDGLVIAAIFTNIGFGAFGAHALNCWPIIMGALISIEIMPVQRDLPINFVSILFSTTIAPIAGVYGWKWGVLAGMLHVFVVSISGSFYAGLNLYNNGFSGGLVAAFIVVMVSIARGREE